jgi:hypothetical protein
MGCCSNCSNCKSAYASSFNPDPCYCCADYFPDSQQPSPQLLPMASSCPSAASARLPVQPPLLRPFSSLFCFLLLCLLFSQLTISQSTPLNQKHSAIANVPWPFLKSVPESWAIGGHRERRSTRRLSSASAEVGTFLMASNSQQHLLTTQTGFSLEETILRESMASQALCVTSQ